jgi:hypothetical protein
MVVSIVLERNPELEFQDKVDLDRLVKEAFHEFQKDESRLKEIEKQVSQEANALQNVLNVPAAEIVSNLITFQTYV